MAYACQYNDNVTHPGKQGNKQGTNKKASSAQQGKLAQGILKGMVPLMPLNMCNESKMMATRI
jgi:hypothetical protein